jgi:uncharacterized protein (DUF2336 family)
MTDGTSHLHRLLELAKEPSSDKRRDLLRDVTDLFLENATTYTDAEKGHFGAIIGKVAQDMEVAVRAHLAEQLAAEGAAPPDLIRKLAHDHIDVARPILLNSGVLREQDLISVAQSQGQDHLATLAKRPAVSAAVSDVLVSRGDDKVLINLVSNQSAQISREAMETIVDRSEKNEALQGPLVKRPDLPVDLLQDMFIFVAKSVREQALTRLKGVSPESVERALADAQKRFSRTVSQGNLADAKAETYINEKHRKRELNEGALVQMLRSGMLAEFISGLARLSELDTKTARRLVLNRNVEAIAIVCKSARFDRATFSAISLLIDATPARSVSQTYDILSLYDKIPPDVAQRAMRFWKVRASAAQAPAGGGEKVA